ncbi:hypothetical protein DPMN_174169 [Dreissena polymorpha]|uniref:Uncharacterized protein n=1 Tax=Dreissena polymorpha TaxID=45954 RepID=A0A9D4IHL9_DREPO|nr:hypothetical protein DPMN_174169 [Dreissena polymorpha]
MFEAVRRKFLVASAVTTSVMPGLPILSRLEPAVLLPDCDMQWMLFPRRSLPGLGC